MHIHADVNVTTLFQMPSLWKSKPREKFSVMRSNLWRHGRATVDTTVVYSHDAEKQRQGTTGFVLGRLARTILPATTETFGANDDVQPGEGKFIPGAFTMMVEQPTKIVKSNDVPQGVRRSFS